MTRRTDIIEEARRWIGTPYRRGASVRGAGCDCVGLVRGVWRACCGREPHPLPEYVSRPQGNELAEQLSKYCAVRAAADCQPGDILVFQWSVGSPPGHCAILCRPDSMVHSYAMRSVTETALTRWWRRRLVAGFAFPGNHVSWDN
ncbi:NlpC/P60 family protein [Hyphobacterium sp.]|uniref:NlpC/P60 family protein n=1 Tax=Hyphobacterium sp. TaxID=2004662 RepID=UPI003B52B737